MKFRKHETHEPTVLFPIPSFPLENLNWCCLCKFNVDHQMCDDPSLLQVHDCIQYTKHRQYCEILQLESFTTFYLFKMNTLGNDDIVNISDLNIIHC